VGTYLRPNTVAEALAALAERPRLILAGGTDLFPARVGRPLDGDVLDISGLPGLRAITSGEEGWFIPCGATWTDLRQAGLPRLFDGLAAAAASIGGRQIQNAATICGNLCNASPAADGVPNLLALDAEVVLASTRGRRNMHVADFVLGNRATARALDELVLGLHIPNTQRPARSVFLKLGARRYLVISIAMVAAVAEFLPDGRIAAARIAIGACSPVAARLPLLEAALAGRRADPALVRPEHLAPLAPIDDLRATATYRLAAVLELLRRAIASLGAEPVAVAA